MEEALCDSLDARDPLVSWSPTQAPCGMDYFDHPSIPEWENSLLLTFLKKQHLRILHLDETGTEVTHEDSILYNEYGRLRDVLVAPNGRVFVTTSNQEINGWNYLAAEEDDRILELVNPDFLYDALVPVNDLNEVFLTQLLETPQAGQSVPTACAGRRFHVSARNRGTGRGLRVRHVWTHGRGRGAPALHGPGCFMFGWGPCKRGSTCWRCAQRTGSDGPRRCSSNGLIRDEALQTT